MTDIDRRIGELMMRLRLSRRAATRRALDEFARPAPPLRPLRRGDFHLAR